MTVPSWWAFVLLALAAYRLTRLVGWDDFPPVAATRDWATGAEALFTEEGPAGWAYRRPLLAHFLQCPFCVGFWIGLVLVGLWWVWPHGTLLVCVPFALNGVVGLVSKNLDA